MARAVVHMLPLMTVNENSTSQYGNSGSGERSWSISSRFNGIYVVFVDYHCSRSAAGAIGLYDHAEKSWYGGNTYRDVESHLGARINLIEQIPFEMHELYSLVTVSDPPRAQIFAFFFFYTATAEAEQSGQVHWRFL